MKKQNYIYLIIALVLLIVIIGFGLSRSGNTVHQTADLTIPATSTTLISEEQFFDFGTIAMANGKVTHSFKVKNTGPEPVSLSKLYTSCMCTEVTLVKADGKRVGPFGMPGHTGSSIAEETKPDESFSLEVTFDPAAHGPAGVGKIEREIYLEGPSSLLLKLAFSANVTP